MTAAIAALRTRLVRIPLTRPWAPDRTDVQVVEVVVETDAGERGTGFTWTPTIGGAAVQALLDVDLAPFAIGRPAEPDWWDAGWVQLHEAGGSGITTFALAGLDLALWDLRARRAGVGLPELLGRRHAELPAYGSGINRHYGLDELAAQAQRWVDAGFGAAKLKVGGRPLAEDVDRVRLVRSILGPDRRLMVDANQLWSLDEALDAVRAFEGFAPHWYEEPFRAEELATLVEFKRRTGVRVAVGENVHTLQRFREHLDAGAVDVVQPNVVRVGGITPFLRIAGLARERGAELAPHLLPELSAQLAFALPEPVGIEWVEDAGFGELGALAEPSGIELGGGVVRGGPALGLGLRFR